MGMISEPSVRYYVIDEFDSKEAREAGFNNSGCCDNHNATGPYIFKRCSYRLVYIEPMFVASANLLWGLEQWETLLTNKLLSLLRVSNWLEKRNTLHLIPTARNTFPFTR